MLLMTMMASPRETAETEQRREYLLTLEEDIRMMSQGDKEALGHFYDRRKLPCTASCSRS